MFGVTTPCVQAVRKLEHKYDCLVHMRPEPAAVPWKVGGPELEGVIDITTTERSRIIFWGVLSAGEDAWAPSYGSSALCGVVRRWRLSTLGHRILFRNATGA
jgi:uncharacterized protein (UPF0261 family)